MAAAARWRLFKLFSKLDQILKVPFGTCDNFTKNKYPKVLITIHKYPTVLRSTQIYSQIPTVLKRAQRYFQRYYQEVVKSNHLATVTATACTVGNNGQQQQVHSDPLSILLCWGQLNEDQLLRCFRVILHLGCWSMAPLLLLL